MPMQKIPLGSSNLCVTKLCLGTMTFGEQNDSAEAHSQLDYALERGINFIDTAEIYPVMPRKETQGASERIIGEWLQKTGNRDRIILASKISGPSRNIDWIRGSKNDLNEANIRAAVEGSLQRLQTDYIDLYQLHWPSRNVPIYGQIWFNPEAERPCTPIEETLAALDKLVKEGKIRHIGVSNESAWGVCEYIKQAEIKGLPRIASTQNAYHLGNRIFESGLDEVCFRENVGLIAYSPLGFGQLTGKYVDNPQAQGRLTIFPASWSPRFLRPTMIEATRRYVALARDHGLTPAQMALAWCYSRWFIDATIIGATRLSQLQENIDALSIELSDEIEKEINAIHADIMNPGQ
ncbi:MAG: yhdN 2 [Burkholderiaceae bacterium]|nr:yhdN 2 [Burkholderiaceae bacterium]